MDFVLLHGNPADLEHPYYAHIFRQGTNFVLLICKACIDSGCHIITRRARQNTANKQTRLDAERARGVLRQGRGIGDDASHGDVGVVGDEEAQVVEEAEDQPQTAPRRPRRNTGNDSPSYILLYYILHVVFAYELNHLSTLCVQLIS